MIVLSNKELKEERPSLGKFPPLYKNRLPLTYKCNDNCIFCYDGADRETVPDFKSEDYMLRVNIKPSACRPCKFYNNDKCVGISPVYLSLYGQSDLVPQKKKKWLFF